MNTAAHLPAMESGIALPVAFLDTSVVIRMLKGEQPSASLLDDAVKTKARLAVNPVVLLQALALPEAVKNPALLNQLQEQLTVLPVDYSRSAEVLESNASLRQYLHHSNDVLILGNALDCDYLLTYDCNLVHAATDRRLNIVTPEQFLDALGVGR
jgi:predicted nucleic acid-binding protein